MMIVQKSGAQKVKCYNIDHMNRYYGNVLRASQCHRKAAKLRILKIPGRP
jgi:hypothetical protein